MPQAMYSNVCTLPVIHHSLTIHVVCYLDKKVTTILPKRVMLVDPCWQALFCCSSTKKIVKGFSSLSVTQIASVPGCCIAPQQMPPQASPNSSRDVSSHKTYLITDIWQNAALLQLRLGFDMHAAAPVTATVTFTFCAKSCSRCMSLGVFSN